MSEMSNFLEDEILDHILGEGAKTFSPAGLWIALSTGTLTDTSTGASMTEVADSNNYSRQAVSFNDASGGSATSNGAVSFTATGGSWGTITDFAIVDSATHGAGNVFFYSALDNSRIVNDGDTLTFADTAVTVSIT